MMSTADRNALPYVCEWCNEEGPRVKPRRWPNGEADLCPECWADVMSAYPMRREG